MDEAGNVKCQSSNEIQSSNDKSFQENSFDVESFGIPLKFGF
jgi:hypothetical protein